MIARNRSIVSTGVLFPLRAVAARSSGASASVARSSVVVPLTSPWLASAAQRLAATAAFGVVMPGKPTFIRFTPDKTGEFLYVCDVFCGSGHESLEGSLFVT